MHPLSPIECLLLTSGCRITITSRKKRILNFLFLILIILIYSGDLAANMDQFWRWSKRPIGHIKYWCDSLFGISFILIMRRNRDQMSVLIHSCIKSLSREQMSVLKKHSLKASFVSILINLIDTTYVVVHLIATEADFDHVRADVPSLMRNLNQWFLAGIFLYTFMVKMIDMREENYFHRLRQQVQEAVDPESLAHDRWILSRERTELFGTLSVIPVFWFTRFFIEAASAIMDTIESSHTKAERLTTLIPFFADAAVLFYLIFLCDSVSLKVRRRGGEAIADLMSQKKVKQFDALVTQIRESIGTEFTAGSMFDINRRFILSLTSSLITFTVLFIQMANSARGTL